MCTATWLHPGEDGREYQVFFSRDELDVRAVADPPAVVTTGPLRYVAPSDPDAGGTWIGVNEAGITVALLNRYRPEDHATTSSVGPSNDTISRGLLVRKALRVECTEELTELIEAEPLDRYRPFDLLCFQPAKRPLRIRWFEGRLSIRPSPRMPQTSSSYRAGAVIENRIAVFNRRFPRAARTPPTDRELEAYHRSHDPNRSALSVYMHRRDAHTHSFSRISVDEENVVFVYVPGNPCETAPRAPVIMRRLRR